MVSETSHPDRYRRVRLIGEGGAGRVWLVTDRFRPGVRIALKELSEISGAGLAGLRHEFATLTQLSHPNLVSVHDLELEPDEGLPRFTMEYVEGEEIAAAVRQEGHELLLRLAAEALRALAFLHDFDLIHRDLKPANLKVRRRPRLDTRLVVLDFGLAMRGGIDESEAGTTSGTLSYLAPEIFERAAPNPRTDLYSLGAVLHEAVHGAPPVEFDGSDFRGFVKRVREGRRLRPPVPPGYPEGLQGWLDELLSPAPGDRPARAAEAMARLNATCGTRFETETPEGRAARLASGAPPGREYEIESLWQHLSPSEGPRVIWLCGGPGSGKRRLTRWLAGEAVAQGWEVARPQPGELTEDRTRPDFDHLLERVRKEAEARPTLVLLEQVESAGTALIEFLERVAREGKAPPLRVVASLRPGEIFHPRLERMVGLTGTVPTLRRVNLEPLAPSGVRAMVERATGLRGVADSRLRWMHETTGGEPHLLETLLVEGTWEQRERSVDEPAAGGSFAPRLKRLSPAGTGWLEALSVLGVEAPYDLVTAIAQQESETAAEAAEELVAAGLARRQDGRWVVSSRVLAEQVLDWMPDDGRTDRHRRAAELLEEQGGKSGNDLYLRARLWSGAAESELAVERALAAADHAWNDGDPLQAAECMAFALRHLSRRDERRGTIRLAQARYLRKANLPRKAVRAYGAALRYAKQRGERAEILARQAGMLVQAARFERGRTAAAEAIRLAREERLPRVAASAKEAIGIAVSRVGDHLGAVHYLEEAAEEFGALGDKDAQAHALQALGTTQLNAGQTEGIASIEHAIELFDSLGDPRQGLMSRIGLGVLDHRFGRYESARKKLDEVRRLAAEQHNILSEAIALYTLARTALVVGRYAETVALCQEAEDNALHVGDYRVTCGSRAIRAQALVQCGHAAEAIALMESTLEGSMERVDLVIADETKLGLAEALLAGRQPDEARIRPILDAALENARRHRDPDTRLFALVLELERRAEAIPREQLKPVADELFGLVAQGGFWNQPFFVNRARVAQARSLLAAGKLEATLERAGEATMLARRHDHPALGAHALVLASEASRRLGRSAEEALALEKGRELLDNAAERITDAELRKGFLDRQIFRALRRRLTLASDGSDRRLLALYDMIGALNSQTDRDELMESILDMAIEVVEAERGMILLRDSSTDAFSVRLARNLERETIEDAESYSRHIVAEAGAGKPVLTLDAGQDERFQSVKSVSLYGIRSLMCVPLRSRDEIVGTVYLDSRREGRMFNAEDLRFLEAFADHASLALENARSRARLVEENRRLRTAAEERVRYDNLVGRCAPMQRVFDLIEKSANCELTVLIQGETGTGKELVARAVHFNGARKKAPFVSENCAALPENLLQSELFGHVRGSFTGADRDRRGMFEQASGGTLFLDEIGDMSLSMQAQLLRVLQEGEVRRVGGDQRIRVDVRVLAATHRDLQQEVEAGRFREDLMYRIQVLVISLPPLRERPGDVALLADHFVQQIARERGHAKAHVSARLLAFFEEYPWPGNVRQLENALRRLTVLAGGETIDETVLQGDPVLARMLRPSGQAAPQPVFAARNHTREQITEALRAAEGNRTRAARMLGVSRATLYRKLKQHGL